MVNKKNASVKKTAVDSTAKNPATLSDGCNPELVEGAKFDGIFEMPVIKKPKKVIIPELLVPFSEMDRAEPDTFAVCTYENDNEFKELLINPEKYVEIIKQYQGFVTPDCSVYETEMRDSYKGLKRIANRLRGSLNNPNLGEAERNYLQDKLSETLSYLDRIKRLFDEFGGI